MEDKWYFKTSTLVVLFLVIGPFALPLLWLNPRCSKKTKIIASVLVLIASYFLGKMLVSALKSIKGYYNQILTQSAQ